MGVLFSRGGDLNQSTQHEELLSWAAEIVARQRETQQADQRGDQSNPESGSRVQRTRYFASLTDLLRELLHEGECGLITKGVINLIDVAIVDGTGSVKCGPVFGRHDNGGGDLNQSTQHEELLSWAAEIVARQRETQQADQRGDQSNPESGSRVQRTRYFASLTDLLRELLHEGEINLHPMSRYRGLNEGPMQSSEDESEDGEYLIGLRGRNAFEPQSSTNDEMHGDDERIDLRHMSPTSANSPTNCEENADKYLNDSREYLLSEIKLHCGELAGWMGIEKMTAMREMGLLYGCRRRSGRAEFSRHPTRAAFSSFQRASASNFREYLLSEIKLHCGELAGWMGIEKMTAMREMGLLYGCRRRSGRAEFSRHPTRAAFSSFQRASASNLFFPNRRKVVEKVRTKTFCCQYMPDGDGLLTASQGSTFFPNRRKVVEKVRTKTFCCQYMPDGDGLLTASQDELIRLYEREGYRQRYKLSNCFQAPYVGWSILDLVVSPDSRHCVYCTWSEKCMRSNVSLFL
uniref:WD_REPEATS_REGION domain-containing protein n=1 Tax=Ascaris lumbricoides TaxID=6252 RepID=A0A0M3IHG9_ASCLU